MTILYPNKLGGPPSVLGIIAASVQQASLAAFFVAAMTLLFWRKPHGGLAQLAPTGKMGLTTYLMQSAFGVVVFYGIGLGLLGKVGAAASIALGLLFFAAQIQFARWWLHRFSMGPVEWLWRLLTHFKAPPDTRVVRSSVHA
jgi:uncharacterized protein